MDTKELFTVAEFCEATGLCRTRVYAMLNEGQLTAFKVGRRTLFRREDVEAWKASLVPYKPLTMPPSIRDLKKGGEDA